MTTTSNRTRAVAEAPFWLEINGRRTRPWTCLPEHLDALAAGWLVAEGFLNPDDPAPPVETIEDYGIFGVRVRLPDERVAHVEAELKHRREHGCGLLHFVRCDGSKIRRTGRSEAPPDADFAELFRALYAAADRYRDTGGLHSAAISDGSGLLYQVEEIGRHNAVDKVIGLARLEGRPTTGLGLVVTARISAELALKAARARLDWIASRSVPTTLALDIAGVAGITIVARAAGKDARVYRPGHAPATIGRRTAGGGIDSGIGPVGSGSEPAAVERTAARGEQAIRARLRSEDRAPTIGARPFGAVLAGGRSRRYGAPKALAGVGGRRIVDRVLAVLGEVSVDPVLIANDASLFSDLELPQRPDVRPGLGVLGGILTALHWAREEGRPGILAVACDMPFLSPALLRRLLAEAQDADIVAAESGGRRGVEPLCAYYGVGCIPAIEAELERGDRHIIGFFGDVRVRRVPLADVLEFGDPDVLFLNVNTPEERERAERIAAWLVDAGHHA